MNKSTFQSIAMRTAILTATVGIFFGVTVPLQAASTPKATGSATTLPQLETTIPTASPSEEEINKNLKDRIMGIVAEQSDPRSPAEKSRKALVGQVDKVTAESIFIKTNRTQEAIKLSPQRTTILDFTKQTPLQYQDIELGSWAVVLGVVTDDDVLEARRILITSTSPIPKPLKVFFGSISKINSSSISVTINNETTTAKIGRSTKISDKDGNKLATSKLKPDMKVIMAIPEDQIASGSALLIRLTQELPAEKN